jgi:hypothetical protein
VLRAALSPQPSGPILFKALASRLKLRPDTYLAVACFSGTPTSKENQPRINASEFVFIREICGYIFLICAHQRKSAAIFFAER